MLRRRPTRLELKPEDKEEYELAQQQKAQAAAAAGKPPLKESIAKPKTTAQRIGLEK